MLQLLSLHMRRIAMNPLRYALCGLLLIIIVLPLTGGTGTLTVNKGCGATYYPGEQLFIYYKVSAPAATTIKATLQVELPDGTVTTFFTDKTLVPNMQYVAPGVIGAQLGTRTVKLIWKEPPLLILYTQTCTYTVSSGGSPGTTLRIDSNVTNFQVWWNGVYNHTTPYNYALLYNVPSGTHTVTLKKAGCTDASKSVTIIPSVTNQVTIAMSCGPDEQEETPDIDGDGVPDDEDGCYNPDCNVVDNKGCPKDTDRDGVNECDDRCPTEKGSPDNRGCPELKKDKDTDGVPDDEDSCYNPDCDIVDSQGCPKDDDGDGLDNCRDECPNKAGERQNKGCPVKDSDSDGVPDDEDTCYNPGCTLVDSQGCPWDSDNDGLNDCEDNCPNQAGPPSNNGCAEEPTFCLGTVFVLFLICGGIFKN
jgi:hypothetical protein